MIVSFPCSAAVVKFTDTKLSVSEPGTVEVFVELIGALSFDIDVMVEVDFKTTTGISIFLTQTIIKLLCIVM